MVGDVFNQLRLARQRALNQNGVVSLYEHLGPIASLDDEQELNDTLGQLLMVMSVLDDKIGPMIEADGMHFNRRWGYLSRAGVNDKSQLMRQIEKYADIFTSRVSNFLRYTPFEYFRSPAQLLVHDRPTADALVLSSGVLSSSDNDTGTVPSNGDSQAFGVSSYGAPRVPYTNGAANGGVQWPRATGAGKPVRPAY